MENVVTSLKAAAEPTRLRILALCAEGELTVSELVSILGQSQPRVSRHLKILAEAGLLERLREGSWVFHRLLWTGANAGLVRCLVDHMPETDDQVVADRVRLGEVKAARASAAADYFRRNAAAWDNLRSKHADESVVEQTIVSLLPHAETLDLLDIGTGTGRLLEVLSPLFKTVLGIDLSHDMLAVARANLERAGIRNASVRQGDMMQLPFGAAAFDVVSVHQFLHFADRPDRAITEAARVLKPGGRLVVVDFAPHTLEELRTEHAHRRLGFAEEEVAAWFAKAHLIQQAPQRLAGDPLTVTIWCAVKAKEAP